MKWNLTQKEGALILEMNSNKANLHNPEFFSDFNEAFDVIEKDYPHLPLILTAPGKIFSAGIDFSYAFDLFKRGNLIEIKEWFKNYSGMMLRLFESPRMTIAAMNGHTFAGGMILALCCDFRIAVSGTAQYTINEVPVGVPMPSAYTEIIRFRLGNRVANEAILSGDIYDAAKALAFGFVKKIVEPAQLIDEAIKQSKAITPDCTSAYVHSKKMLQHPTLQFIRDHSAKLEEETYVKISSQESIAAQMAAFKRLQKN